jgi:hypothetical protein
MDQEPHLNEPDDSRLESATRRPNPELPSLGIRITLILVGWLVLMVGIAGLVLPGIQGIITILLGAAILSAASDRVHSWVNRALSRWPSLAKKMDTLRHRLLIKLSRHK